MHPYQKLLVWQRANALARDIYGTTASWRDQNLTAQLRRAVTSVPANIVEGAGSVTQSQFARYLGFALASAHETHNHIDFAHEVGYLENRDHDRYGAEIVAIKKMLTALLRTVKQNDASRTLAAKRSATSTRRTPA